MYKSSYVLGKRKGNEKEHIDIIFRNHGDSSDNLVNRDNSNVLQLGFLRRIRPEALS